MRVHVAWTLQCGDVNNREPAKRRTAAKLRRNFDNEGPAWCCTACLQCGRRPASYRSDSGTCTDGPARAKSTGLLLCSRRCSPRGQAGAWKASLYGRKEGGATIEPILRNGGSGLFLLLAPFRMHSALFFRFASVQLDVVYLSGRICEQTPPVLLCIACMLLGFICEGRLSLTTKRLLPSSLASATCS